MDEFTYDGFADLLEGPFTPKTISSMTDGVDSACCWDGLDFLTGFEEDAVDKWARTFKLKARTSWLKQSLLGIVELEESSPIPQVSTFIRFYLLVVDLRKNEARI
jgi:hypothetical protein